MNIIIVGCGKIGQNLAEQLNEQGNNITVVDISPEKVQEVSTR
ncbi:MAG: NAD-binding protein, partial [Clostridia bacterium]|nr:NAD-binding protein [Clostridia bacterium]